MSETETKPSESLVRPRTLTKVVLALALPILPLALIGGPISILLLYIVLVIDGIGLAYFAISRVDASDQMPIRRRINDIGYGGSYFSDSGVVGSLASEVTQAARTSNYYSLTSRGRIARLLSEVLRQPGSGSRIRQADAARKQSNDLRILLSYNGSPDRTPPKKGGRDIDYLSSLERAVSMLEESVQ